ncbi:TPA: hypothetical protein DEF17_00490 [bacterium]|nr:MAG: hypothetical protein AUJ18_07090 [Candidatus Hydrogenedentes bacterium CG1_02_42_14]PIU46625.1 MAG: hypothetical protein COS94_09620 [Candidatus Hydrogenedentes bacterium CG07_land_8_20_14_0_80_42_17]HBW46396.1 hypothetical protein [bacterium]
MKGKNVRFILSISLALLISLGITISLSSCQTPGQPNDIATIPEAKLADWSKLRSLVKDYDACRADADQRNVLIIQNGFRELTERNSNNKIGDEALYYVGRIYYDIRDYHDARVTLIKHKEIYTDSEFSAAIVRLEAEMDKDAAAYQEWLDHTRTTTTAY